MLGLRVRPRARRGQNGQPAQGPRGQRGVPTPARAGTRYSGSPGSIAMAIRAADRQQEADPGAGSRRRVPDRALLHRPRFPGPSRRSDRRRVPCARFGMHRARPSRVGRAAPRGSRAMPTWGRAGSRLRTPGCIGQVYWPGRSGAARGWCAGGAVRPAWSCPCPAWSWPCFTAAAASGGVAADPADSAEADPSGERRRRSAKPSASKGHHRDLHRVIPHAILGNPEIRCVASFLMWSRASRWGTRDRLPSPSAPPRGAVDVISASCSPLLSAAWRRSRAWGAAKLGRGARLGAQSALMPSGYGRSSRIADRRASVNGALPPPRWSSSREMGDKTQLAKSPSARATAHLGRHPRHQPACAGRRAGRLRWKPLRHGDSPDALRALPPPHLFGTPTANRVQSLGRPGPVRAPRRESAPTGEPGSWAAR